MRALTLHQPWAWAITRGYKFHETRSWSTDYRGPLAIHAGKTIDWAFINGHPLHKRLPIHTAPMDTGAIVAIATLADCAPTELVLNNDIEPWDIHFGDWAPGRFAWWLIGIHALDEPIPCRGYQGLWTPNEDIVAQIAKAA